MNPIALLFGVSERKLLALPGVVLLGSLLALPAAAECPEGKSEVVVTTPSGKSKTLCIANQAIPGIENAAEHSGGTIDPVACSCWTADALVSLFSSVYRPDLFCRIVDKRAGLSDLRDSAPDADARDQISNICQLIDASGTLIEFDDTMTQPQINKCFDDIAVAGSRLGVSCLSCTSNDDCMTDEYCELPIGTCGGTGHCRWRAEMCPMIWDPVCGCDGQTHDSPCWAGAAGVSVDYAGECAAP